MSSNGIKRIRIIGVQIDITQIAGRFNCIFFIINIVIHLSIII